MQNIYIVKSKDNRLHCFYHSHESGINLRTYENKKWGVALNIVPDASENYTLTLSENGSFYIFCSDNFGNINLCTNNMLDNKWNTQLVLKNQSPIVNAVIFTPIITNNGLKLIYNVPSPEDKSHFIMTQQLYANGEWGTPSRVDRISALPNNIFVTQQTSNEHLLLFYQTKTPETNLCYRELTSEQVGNLNIFHSTTYQITDTSFLTTSDAVHMLYIVKSLFSTQLQYRKRNETGFSNALPIWEGQRLDNCSLFIINGIIYASFISAGSLYLCQSDDKGDSFSRPVKYKNSFCRNPVKANFISQNKMYENKYYTREVYVDRNSPFDVQILPDFIDDFYPKQIVEQENTPLNTETKIQSKYQYTDHYDPFGDMMADFAQKQIKPEAEKPFNKIIQPTAMQAPQNNNINNIQNPPHEDLLMLKASLKAALEHNASKERQITNLSNLIETKNREISALEREVSELQKSIRETQNRTRDESIASEKNIRKLTHDIIELNELIEKLSKGQKSNNEMLKEKITQEQTIQNEINHDDSSQINYLNISLDDALNDTLSEYQNNVADEYIENLQDKLDSLDSIIYNAAEIKDKL